MSQIPFFNNPHEEVSDMTPQNEPMTRYGKIRYGLAALLLGLPLPIVLIAFLAPGCNH
ncbi:MAG TPA: hypothetical protein VG122_01600 [Gemmata sp.]|nr:hypothetical protein [Gemmata sp.]